MRADFYVSLQGNDAWSGKLAEPNSTKTDGPFASIDAARSAISRKRKQDKFVSPMVVALRGGRYPVAETISMNPGDSFITFCAYENEKPVFDAGYKVSNWTEEKVNGVTAWSADVKDVMEKTGYFHQLFVNGKRANRPRLPKKDFYWVEDVPETPADTYHCFAPLQKERFVAKPGDVKTYHNINDVECIIPHWWIEERRNLASYDATTRMVKLSEPLNMIILDGLNKRYAKYWLENVFEALTDAGEWYLDRVQKKLYYIPAKGESMATTEVFIPGIESLLSVKGEADKNRFVEGVVFEGVTFEHGDWKVYNKAVQAAGYGVPSAILFEAAQNCAMIDCSVQHVGVWGVEIGKGCSNVKLSGNNIVDIGAGGIKINGCDAFGPRHDRTSNISVTDNEITQLGRVHHSATGIMMGHAARCLIAHNHIADLYYTGISCGWVWGYSDNVSKENIIEKNRIHNVGQELLSDMGGIYTLGSQPGTCIRGNLIYDVTSSGYGGWGIYPDEGSSYMVIENNVVYDTSCQPFHLHYGTELAIRNNIWAFGHEGTIAVSRGPKSTHCDGFLHTTGSNFTFERNIVLTDGQPMFVCGMDDEFGNLEEKTYLSDLNMFYDIKGKDLFCVNAGHQMRVEGYKKSFTWKEYLSYGYEEHSTVGDPGFKSIEKRDFTLAKDSPAFKLGFKPIDISDVGPRPKTKK